MQHRYRIEGMDCAEEVALLKRELVPLVGEESLGFDLLNAKLTVDTNDATIGKAEIENAIARSGLKASIWKSKPDALSSHHRLELSRYRDWSLLLASNHFQIRKRVYFLHA